MLLARQQSADFELEDVAEVRHAAQRHPAMPVAAARVEAEPIRPSHYAGSSNRFAPALIAAAHVAVIALLLKYDVLTIAHKRADPVMIDLKPLVEAPPPQPQRKPLDTPRQIEMPIVTPPPIVQTPIAPPPLAAVSVSPPVAPQPVAAPAAPTAVIAAPIVPPDASAATLGNVPPRYPIESRRSHEEGTVRLRVLISPEGAVEEIAVARTSGYDRLDKAALETVRKWRFRAGTQAGKAVEAVGYLSIPFVLSR
jgi:protein TonB